MFDLRGFILFFFLMLLILGGIALIFFIGLWRIFVRKPKSIDNDKHWYLRVAFSSEHFFSDIFLTLGLGLLFGLLFALNRSLHGLVEVQTVLLVTTIFAFIIGYYLKALYPVIAAILASYSWWFIQAGIWIGGNTVLSTPDIQPVAIVVGTVFISLLLYVVGMVHDNKKAWKRFGVVYSLVGILGVTLLFFFLSTRVGIEAFEDLYKGSLIFSSWQLTTGVLILGLLVLGAIAEAARRKAISLREVSVAIVLLLFSGALLFLPVDTYDLVDYNKYGVRELNTYGSIWAIIFNVISFLLMFGILLSGYLRRESWQINLGAFLLFILIIVKYFDWFFEFLDKSLFFLLAGLLMLAVGYFMEKGRRYVLIHMKN